MEQVKYQKGEFCSHIRCVHYPNLMMDKKSACQRCLAYKFHDYIQKNFEPLIRKKPEKKC
ncbi:MAG: hypothetical protein ACQESF_02555 [Nanobdellota archaeon]